MHTGTGVRDVPNGTGVRDVPEGHYLPVQRQKWVLP